jgi:hypothetical protein
MKITCDSCPRGFLSVDETARKLPDAFVARSELRVARAIDFLGATPARVLSQQPADEKGLEGDEGECAHDVPLVQLPGRWVSELDDGSGREASIVNAPPPELAPIKGGYQPFVFERDVLSARPVEDLQRKFCGTCSKRLRASNGAANDTLPHVRGLRSIDRHWRRLSNGARYSCRKDHVARTFLGVANVEHDASSGNGLDRGGQALYRWFVDIDQLDGRRCRSTQSIPDPGQKIGGRGLGDDKHLFRERMELQGEFERLAERHVAEHPGESCPLAANAGRWRGRAGKHDRGIRKQLVSMSEHELQCRLGDRNYQVDLSATVFRANVVAQRRRRLCRGKTIGLQVFGVVVDQYVGARRQDLSDGAVHDGIGRKIFTAPLDGEYGLVVLRLCQGCRAYEKGSDECEYGDGKMCSGHFQRGPLQRRARLGAARRRDQQHEHEDQSGYSHSNVLVGGGWVPGFGRFDRASNAWQSMERANASQVGPWSYDRVAMVLSLVRPFTIWLRREQRRTLHSTFCAANSTLTPAHPVCG